MSPAGGPPPGQDSAQGTSPLPIRAEIDLEALRANVAWLRGLAGDVPLMGVVKADAYGHGAAQIVPPLRREGIGIFGVANVPEAIQLRGLGVTEPILVFGQPLPAYLPAYEAHGLDVTVASRAIADEVRASGRPTRVHVKVDTGMHRLGLAPEEAPEVVAALQTAPHVTVVAVWTHLATADEADLSFAREQLERFAAVRTGLPADTAVHIANSGALVQLPEAVRGCAFVRPGGLLYGMPSSALLAERAPNVRPVMRLVSRVIHLHTVAAGETVSYGRTWRAGRPSRLATIAAGYGDGVPRQLSNRGEVAIRGQRFPIAGRVCMDMLMVDLGDPAGASREVELGDAAILFGSGGPSLLEAAAAAETMPYTLPTGLAARVPRLVVRQ